MLTNCPILRIACVLLIAAVALDPRTAQARDFGTGPVELRHSLTFYIVNDAGRDFTAAFEWRDEQQVNADRPRLIRVFDPQERLIVRHFEPCERIDDSRELTEHRVQLSVPAAGGGVYQIIVTGFGGTSQFSTTPSMPWGVLGFPRLVGRGRQFSDAFIYLPPGLDQLSIRCEGAVERLRLIDDNGLARIDAGGPGAFGQTAVPIEGGRVWRLSITAPEQGEPYRIDFAGAPIIVCPDAITATAIRGSVDVLSDGTVCFHKFQIRAHELLGQCRQLPRRAFTVNLPPLQQYRTAWAADAARHDLLLGGAGVVTTLPLVLREQNLDSSSPWFGTIKIWHDGPRQGAKPHNPWTRIDRLNLTRAAPFNNVLAAAYSIDEPFNLLHRDSALRQRIIIAALQDLMMLREHEMPLAVVPDQFWGGERAFAFAGFLQPVSLVIADCPAAVRQTLLEGLRRYVERESISQVASTVNQWSFIIRGLQHFADATGQADDRQMVERHLRWLLARNQWDCGHMPAGYFFEIGPDATYNGIALHNLGWVYERLRRQGESQVAGSLGTALQQCLNLFNHTIAPQPDGSLLGASNFCTRTPGDWTQPQHGAGVAMLADEFTEAGPLVGRVWPTIRPLRRDLATQRANQEALIQRLEYWTDESEIWRSADTIASGPEIHFLIWQHFASAPRGGRLPVLAQDHFTRNFGDEFFCVRRPRYYSLLYAGTPMPEWTRDRRPLDPRRQFPRNGGGLSMFWSPAFGVSLLAHNWSAYAANTIIIESAGPAGTRIMSEDYWSVRPSFEEPAALATVAATILNHPLECERRYRFLDIGVECNLTLRASGPLNATAAWECFPYPDPDQTRLLVTLVDDQGRPVNKRPASAVVFRNASHEAHVLVFAQPRNCEMGGERVTDDQGKVRTFNRVLADLPADLSAGEQRTLRWCLMVVPAAEVPRAIRAAVTAMAR